MAFFNLAIVVSGFFSSAFHKAPLILNASFWVDGVGGGGTYTFLYPALLLVLLWLVFLSVSLHSVLFGGSAHVTACVRVISHTIVNRW